MDFTILGFTQWNADDVPKMMNALFYLLHMDVCFIFGQKGRNKDKAKWQLALLWAQFTLQPVQPFLQALGLDGVAVTKKRHKRRR